ncbi:MAG TPA: fucose-binding protein [Actinobacteria bacterium]|jgi:L-fucose mutarotase|nr:fucose-binding protein [Actinomycetota bacterium]
MLKGVDPLLSGELLKVLDDMGHGDQLALVDRNFPAVSSGRPVIRLGEVTILRAAEAILSVLPLDSFQPRPLERMEVEDDPSRTTPVQDDLLDLAARLEGRSLEYGVIPRLDFYRRVSGVVAVVHTLDSVPYGCFILHKGVVFD